jgi:hypothetical protein
MLVVIASFPKSGNTWVRRFLISYIAGKAVPLNEMARYCPTDTSIGLWKRHLKEADIPTDQYAAMRSQLFQTVHAAHRRSMYFLKSHCKNDVWMGAPLFDHAAIDRYIHVVRNPFDVLSSWAYHQGLTIPDAWERMRDDDLRLAGETEYVAPVGSWGTHLETWMRMAEDPRYLIVRYEDLCRKPITTFSKIVSHVGHKVDEPVFLQTLFATDFQRMRDEEAAIDSGFVEAQGGRPFFRRGGIGHGAKEVPAPIRTEIVASWGPLMKRCGYTVQ